MIPYTQQKICQQKKINLFSLIAEELMKTDLDIASENALACNHYFQPDQPKVTLTT
ncbi:hypothetical protein [Methyloprofundus sp.]|uniref:hypothetical protein n=1 Tax=Methyloprofundus sp. TaxID=2020875 RepID=UPI003D121EF2